jgi:pyrroloquinoline quinone (PQQ) biosynthesis protein C
MGEVSRERLARYAFAYVDFIAQMPVYWSRIGVAFVADTRKIVAEETAHIQLWKGWMKRLPEPADYPRMTELLDTYAGFSSDELLGAVQAFEIQQPAVAETKKTGLLQHYGFTEEDTVYFDEHLHEHEHIEFGTQLSETKADQAGFRRGFNRGAKVVYHSLDLF